MYIVDRRKVSSAVTNGLKTCDREVTRGISSELHKQQHARKKIVIHTRDKSLSITRSWNE